MFSFLRRCCCSWVLVLFSSFVWYDVSKTSMNIYMFLSSSYSWIYVGCLLFLILELYFANCEDIVCRFFVICNMVSEQKIHGFEPIFLARSFRSLPSSRIPCGFSFFFLSIFYFLLKDLFSFPL